MRTGSLMNLIAADAATLPEVGSGATLCFWTDRSACTVIHVSEKRIVVQTDKATRTDSNGMSDTQTYAYEADPKGAIHVFTKRKNGKFYEQGSAMGEGTKLSLGARRAYHDYSF